MNCTRCVIPLTEKTRRGTKEEPYCPTCHLIVFYELPADKVDELMAEIEAHRKLGIDETVLQKLLWNALRKLADKALRKSMETHKDFAIFRGER